MNNSQCSATFDMILKVIYNKRGVCVDLIALKKKKKPYLKPYLIVYSVGIG